MCPLELLKSQTPSIMHSNQMMSSFALPGSPRSYWHHALFPPPPFFLFLRPSEQLPPMHVGGPGSWDAVYADTKGDWCGPQLPDAWCGAMPSENTTFSRRAYLASVKFVDEQVRVLGACGATPLGTWPLRYFCVCGRGGGVVEIGRWRREYGGSKMAVGMYGVVAMCTCGAPAPLSSKLTAACVLSESLCACSCVPQIGAVLETLKSTGLDQNTWVLFVSDHGDGQVRHFFCPRRSSGVADA